jgi:hypothetical protein
MVKETWRNNLSLDLRGNKSGVLQFAANCVILTLDGIPLTAGATAFSRPGI